MQTRSAARGDHGDRRRMAVRGGLRPAQISNVQGTIQVISASFLAFVSAFVLASFWVRQQCRQRAKEITNSFAIQAAECVCAQRFVRPIVSGHARLRPTARQGAVISGRRAFCRDSIYREDIYIVYRVRDRDSDRVTLQYKVWICT